jgi:FecR protein
MNRHALKLVSSLSLALAVALFLPSRAAADDDDPPSRVARLSSTHGEVSFNPAGTDDWVTAVVNRPLSTGDKLWTDNGAHAELHMGSAAIRLSGNTGFSFLNLADNVAQIRVTEGSMYVRVRSLDTDETFEVDTPNLAFSILRPGRYRINVNENGDTTTVAVREGEGEVTGGGSAFAIHPREVGTFTGNDQLDSDIQSAGDDGDDFDHWCNDRDRREDHSVSSRYVSSDVIGYEDLDDNGGWRPVAEYGTVWFPHVTTIGWAPYRYGHWVWISPWGWTWVDDAAWGFAPFHYGRWVVVGGVWGWVPCPPRPVVAVAYVRPVYAPALVAWVGGPHWGIGVGVGGVAAGVAWFPLGPRDVYCPSYHVSQRYVENVNISNTTIINKTNVTNVYNNVYVNKTVNVTNIKYQNQTAVNAITATSHQNFTSAQPVGKNMMHVDAREVASAPVAPLTPTVAPQQRSVLGAGAEARVRPPAALATRAVVAKTAPPLAPVSFAKQQQAVQANGGRPLGISEARQLQPERTQTAAAAVKIAPPPRAVTPQNAQGNRPNGNPQNNSGNRPGNTANAGQPPANSGNRPGGSHNPPPNPVSQKTYTDRPPTARPSTNNSSNNVNPQLEQKHQQQLEQLHNQQDQERQKVEQQQQQERQKLAQKNADEQRQRQVDQKHEQQLQQLEQKHDQQQQKLQQKQQQEHQNEKPASKPPKEKDDKPHHR